MPPHDSRFIDRRMKPLPKDHARWSGYEHQGKRLAAPVTLAVLRFMDGTDGRAARPIGDHETGDQAPD